MGGAGGGSSGEKWQWWQVAVKVAASTANVEDISIKSGRPPSLLFFALLLVVEVLQTMLQAGPGATAK